MFVIRSYTKLRIVMYIDGRMLIKFVTKSYLLREGGLAAMCSEVMGNGIVVLSRMNLFDMAKVSSKRWKMIVFQNHQEFFLDLVRIFGPFLPNFEWWKQFWYRLHQRSCLTFWMYSHFDNRLVGIALKSTFRKPDNGLSIKKWAEINAQRSLKLEETGSRIGSVGKNWKIALISKINVLNFLYVNSSALDIEFERSEIFIPKTVHI